MEPQTDFLSNNVVKCQLIITFCGALFGLKHR